MSLSIRSPKQLRSNLRGRDAWYPYYAGYSTEFARSLLQSAHLPDNAVVLDPWNGAGTTTSVARDLGLKSVGFDLNPVMVIAAKARLLSTLAQNSLGPIAAEILHKARSESIAVSDGDPLHTWFLPSTTAAIRHIEGSIQRLVMGLGIPRYLTSTSDIEGLSDLAAFYYIVLFRVVRFFLAPFIPTNPTWTKRPKSSAELINVTEQDLHLKFINLVIEIIEGLTEKFQSRLDTTTLISVARSESNPLANASIDFVLTSPPYCTRIDYAIATMPELAVLGFHPDRELKELRRSLIGASIVPKSVGQIQTAWGPTCEAFLREVRTHPTKASGSYYYKSHVEYFDRLFCSLSEITRVMSESARCVLVVQDSYYKDVHNNLSLIVTEMMTGLGMTLLQIAEFETAANMANVNSGARKYKRNRTAIESVMCFSRH